MSKKHKTPETSSSEEKNTNAPAILKKEEQENNMDKKEFEEREKIAQGYTGSKTKEGNQIKGADKIEERVTDNGSRDDDDDGAYDTTPEGQAADKSSKVRQNGLYNRDENDELKKRETDFIRGDNNQNKAQKNSTTPQKKEKLQ